MSHERLRVAASLSPALAGELLPELVDRGHVVVASEADELHAVVRSGGVDAALIECGPGLDTETLAVCDAAGVRLVALAGSDAGRRRARELGIVDVLRADAPWPQVERLLYGQPLQEETVPESGCTRIAVWGPAGAPGRSTVAVHIAAEIARTGRSVLLVDADPYGGTIAQRLGLLDEVPTFAAAARLTDADGLTRSQFERLAQRYESRSASFWVLTGLIRPERWPELSEERVRRALDACARWVDAIVVDTGFSLESDEEIVSDVRGPRRNACTLAVLDRCDRVVVVGSPDPVGLGRLLRGHRSVCELVDGQRVEVVVNAIRSSAVGIGAVAQVCGTLRRFGGISRPFVVPDDRASFDSAVLAGRLVHDVASRSPALPALRALAEAMLSGAPRSLSRQSRRRRRVRPSRTADRTVRRHAPGRAADTESSDIP